MKEIKAGEIWVSQNPNRSDIEIIRVNIYGKIVYWKYIDNKFDFETPLDVFLKDHTKKQ